MPIQVKTIRDIWDKGKEKKEVKKYKTLPPPFAIAREIEKYYLEYLARKKAFLEVKDEITKAFTDYESRLGDAGFSKI